MSDSGPMHPDLLLPPSAWALVRLRDQAEAEGNDARLLALHELERASAALPLVIDGARRSRLVAVDAISTTWEAWRVADGGRCLLRCLRARWRDDAVMRRRFEAAPARIQVLHPVELRTDGDWPHLRVDAPGSPVIDRFPVEDPPDPVTLARLLATGLQGLARLHEAGRVHGGPLGALLLHGADGARLRWLDPFDPPRGPAEDIGGLAAVVAGLDPTGADPVAQLAAGWTLDPPPSAADGLALLREVLAGHLLSRRHQLVLLARRQGRRDRATRLSQASRALARALPPPAGTACLHADHDGVLTLLRSDGRHLWGGASASLDTAHLPLVWSAERGLDAQAARGLLRAWATRQRGDEALRATLQARLGAADADADLALRWLRAMASLRRAHLLSEHQARSGTAQAAGA